MSLISVHKLSKQYEATEVVRGLDLTIQPGECFGLLGPNGAGKTTTLKMLLGLVSPSSGDIRIGTYRIPEQARLARQTIGVMPQMDNLDPDFTVTENLRTYGRYFGLNLDQLNARIPGLLELTGLTSKADSQIPTLSGGMKRRLTLARALINDPELIVLDEPTTGLDPQARHAIWSGLRRLIQQGKTILLTTHFMEEAERLCDRLAIIDHGQLIATGTPRDLIASEVEPQVTEIYGETVTQWAEQHAGSCCDRHELSDETLYCYTHDSSSLLTILQNQTALRYLQRPSNLEDVFLKLTGRELRD
ncbi:MAG: ATP-binding cassette domain-containing protein [Betaproteobacteria bacterium]|nr:ATP-binding cassette domain-containing protein [Betaproteobacteria bacterium]